MTVERWIEQEDLQFGPSTWEELGSLCGRLHCLPVPPELGAIASRLDPLKTLDEVRYGISRHSRAVPAEFRLRVGECLTEAECLGYMEGLPRAIAHSDITWDNVVRNRGN